eukprot:TRINITY_DN7169_c0_g2_i1.p1 TRINITY_DN7169_c0_g2~~TRINITY_DN7169_c0_g2_i1.p1  ORF type:complete len:108 (+),score=22.12 TRINITY_DN7169_c0_g2_i1:1208-1531(+)
MLKSVNAKVPDISSLTMKVLAMKKEVTLRGRISKMLNGQTLHVTTDIWTGVTGQNFMGLTVGWIDADWGLKILALDSLHISGTHSLSRSGMFFTRRMEWTRTICFVV